MKFLILIYGNPQSRDAFLSLPPEVRAQGLAEYRKLNEELQDSGELITNSSLGDMTNAKQVTVQGGQTLTTDGPFAEVKEYVAGFYFVECDSYDRAVEIAGRIPEARGGKLEIRPTVELAAFEDM